MSQGEEMNVPCPDCKAGLGEYCRTPEWTPDRHKASTHLPFGEYHGARTRLYRNNLPPTKPTATAKPARGYGHIIGVDDPAFMRRLLGGPTLWQRLAAPLHRKVPITARGLLAATLLFALAELGLIFRLHELRKKADLLGEGVLHANQSLEMLRTDMEDLEVRINALTDPAGAAPPPQPPPYSKPIPPSQPDEPYCCCVGNAAGHRVCEPGHCKCGCPGHDCGAH